MYKNIHVFLTVLETEKSKMKMPANVVSREGLFLIDVTSVPSHSWRDRGEKQPPSLSFYNGTNP